MEHYKMYLQELLGHCARNLCELATLLPQQNMSQIKIVSLLRRFGDNTFDLTNCTVNLRERAKLRNFRNSLAKTLQQVKVSTIDLKDKPSASFIA